MKAGLENRAMLNALPERVDILPTTAERAIEHLRQVKQEAASDPQSTAALALI
mgnify:CR=1 FL=1